MDSTETAEPGPGCMASENSDLIGLALVSLPPLECILLSAHFFWAAVEFGLRLKGIEPAGTGGLFGPFFIAWTISTQDRERVLQAVREVVPVIVEGVFSWENCELAYRGKVDWHTVHPQGALPFARFLTPEKFRWARRRFGLIQEAVINKASDERRLLRELRRRDQ